MLRRQATKTRTMTADDSKLAHRTKTDFHLVRFPGTDALVAFVATGTQPTPEIQKQIDARGQSRWYPTEGGHFVKMPHQRGGVPIENFQVEPGGWDHVHCDGCRGHIKTGEQCWVTSDTIFSVICDSCYIKMR
jgi:hypothetical protein